MTTSRSRGRSTSMLLQVVDARAADGNPVVRHVAVDCRAVPDANRQTDRILSATPDRSVSRLVVAGSRSHRLEDFAVCCAQRRGAGVRVRRRLAQNGGPDRRAGPGAWLHRAARQRRADRRAPPPGVLTGVRQTSWPSNSASHSSRVRVAKSRAHLVDQRAPDRPRPSACRAARSGRPIAVAERHPELRLERAERDRAGRRASR